MKCVLACVHGCCDFANVAMQSTKLVLHATRTGFPMRAHGAEKYCEKYNTAHQKKQHEARHEKPNRERHVSYSHLPFAVDECVEERHQYAILNGLV